MYTYTIYTRFIPKGSTTCIQCTSKHKNAHKYSKIYNSTQIPKLCTSPFESLHMHVFNLRKRLIR